MSLQFIYGRAHSGKTAFVINTAKKMSDSGNPVIIVVPEQFTHIAERRLISKLGSVQQGKVEVLSFDRICKRLIASHPTGKNQLSSIGKTLVIAELITNLELSYYKSAASQNGFVDICNDQISELKKYMITPENLLTAAQSVTSEALSMKLNDIAAIYRAYEERLSLEFTDADDSLNILAEILESFRPYERYTFFFDEFSSFNPQEREIISIICSQADTVYVSLSADKSEKFASLFKPTLECAKLLTKLCVSRGCSVLPDVCMNSPCYENNELRFLEENLFSYKLEKYNGEISKVKIFVGENPYSEVTKLASAISALVRERNVRYRDISVIASDIDEYGYIIKSVFDDYNIPYFVDDKTNTLDHSIVSFVVNILDIYINGYNAENVVNYLKSGCISADREDIYIADNYISAARASKNTWLSDDRFSRSVESYSDGNEHVKKALIRIRNNHISVLSQFHDEIKGRHSVKYITEKLYKFLLSINFDKKISDYIKLFKSQNNISLAKQYEAVWNLLIEAFDMLVYILGDKVVNINEYRRYLYTAFNQQQIGLIPTSLDEVVVGDVMRSKTGYAAYQFVIGATDGKFPSSGAEDSLISDAEKNDLTGLGIELSPGIDEKAYFDRFRIYSVLTHPHCALIISYPNSDSGFTSARPALVITTLKNIFPNLRTEGGISSELNIKPDNMDAARQLLAESAAALSDGRIPGDEWKDIYKYFKDSGKTDEIDFINNLLDGRKGIKRLSSEITDLCFKDEFYSTISRIQKYNSCQYAYYLTYMLSLKEKKPFGIENVDIGTLIHHIIETIFTEIKDKRIGLEQTDKIYFESSIDRLLDEYIEQLAHCGSEITPREIFAIKNLKLPVFNSIMAIRDHIVRSEFEPIGHEITFDDDNIGCIEFELDNGKKLKITGKIDRADSFTNEYGTFIRVVDYKTGSKAFNFTDVYYGLDIQLLVYLNALVDKTDDACPAGALFLKIINPTEASDKRPSEENSVEDVSPTIKMDGVVSDDSKVLAAFSPDSISTKNKLTSQRFKLLSEYVNSIVKKASENMSSGYINVNPYSHGEKNSCSYCSYNSICNFVNGKNGSFRLLNTVDLKTVFDEISEGEKEV